MLLRPDRNAMIMMTLGPRTTSLWTPVSGTPWSIPEYIDAVLVASPGLPDLVYASLTCPLLLCDLRCQSILDLDGILWFSQKEVV